MPLGRRVAADYAEFAAPGSLQEIAQALKGARILHLAAAGSRLRSPEILPSLLSLYNDLGVHAEFQTLAGERPFWRLTRQLEDGLQGGETAISGETWDEYLADSPAPEGYDAIIVHGPGPLASAHKAGVPYVFRCELDFSSPDQPMWNRLEPLVSTTADLPEAIDPLAPASVDLPVKLAGSMVRSLGVDLARPTIFRARPFDTWQDPHEVLDAFAIAKQKLPTLQLVLAGDPPTDDVEAWRLVRELSDYTETKDDLLLLSGVGDVEMNALRALARAGVESSIAKGPELSALETLWKGTPVVQASDGAEAIIELLNDPGLAIERGQAGRARVREHHLVTTLAENELRLLASFQST
jgi:trehalose synthase